MPNTLLTTLYILFLILSIIKKSKVYYIYLVHIWANNSINGMFAFIRSHLRRQIELSFDSGLLNSKACSKNLIQDATNMYKPDNNWIKNKFLFYTLLYIRKNLKVNPMKLRNSLPEFLLIQKEVK